MKTKSLLSHAVLLAFLLSTLNTPLSTCLAATTISSPNKYAYGANVGWLDWRGDTNNGAVIGEYICSGYIWGANVGWIHLGDNTPANGIYYQNNSATDCGVNHDGLGNLSGLAYGANIGWIAFTNSTATGPLASTNLPRVNLGNGALSGYAYSANCGWISLSNAFAFVKTDSISMGIDSDGDGITDAWELTYTNSLGGFSALGDADSDGASDQNEYRAGTDPNDADDNLRITYVARGDVVPDFTTLRWTSKPTRFYTIQFRPALDISSPWLDTVGYGFGASNSTFNTGSAGDLEFYRIRAFRPLGP